ncbi:MAG: sigma 54-interacting transcriptional regulator [Syntrophomonadaceae bacterium]|nr:sigma 54-interacting transcriptional regulator [Syntrophomonadaceae bacterium]
MEKNKQNKLDYVIGTSPNFLEAKTKALKAAKNSFSVLITGETGTGKEVIADLIHWVSDRADYPFIKINCAAIPPELFESELFGYEKGAFTGAVKEGKKGKFELAHKGTILLDEIGDLPLNMQTKLLRVLQDGIIEPVGAVKPIPVDVRIIAATNANLEEMIEKKLFRQDLYYRLNEIRIFLPRLSERKSDIIPIAQHVLNKLNWEFETEVSFAPEVLEYLLNYDWPGNIRELNNVVKSAYFQVDEKTIEVAHLPENILLAQANPISIDNTLEEYLNLCEKRFIIKTLKKNRGNRTKTAKSLGIHRSNLYKKIDKYNININDI